MSERTVEKNNSHDGEATFEQIWWMFQAEKNDFWKGVISSFVATKNDDLDSRAELFGYVPQSPKTQKQYDSGRAARWGVKSIR